MSNKLAVSAVTWEADSSIKPPSATANSVITFCHHHEVDNDLDLSPLEEDGELREVGLSALAAVIATSTDNDIRHLKRIFSAGGVTMTEGNVWHSADWANVRHFASTNWPKKEVGARSTLALEY